jgi:GT2 family glycosyltransferase
VRVAAVVVSWNSAPWLPGCLAALRAQTLPPAEVVLVDNGSRDGSAEVARDGGARVIALPGNEGFCAANNRGIAATESPLVLLLNPDTALSPGFLEALVPSFEQAEVGAACGKLLRWDGRTLDSAGQALGWSRRPVDRGYGRPDRGRYDRPEDVFSACGAAALYRRTALAAVAGPRGEVFDPRFFAFYEDLDLAWRLGRAGFRIVYRPQATGRHARGGTAGAAGVRRRFQALLHRPPEVRFHVVKNRWLTLLRNETAAGFLAHLPWIAARDAATLGLLGATTPSVLARLWRERAVFGDAWRGRRLDFIRGRHLDSPSR